MVSNPATMTFPPRTLFPSSPGMALNVVFLGALFISALVSYFVRNYIRDYTNKYEIVPIVFGTETLLILWNLITQ